MATPRAAPPPSTSGSSPVTRIFTEAECLADPQAVLADLRLHGFARVTMQSVLPTRLYAAAAVFFSSDHKYRCRPVGSADPDAHKEQLASGRLRATEPHFQLAGRQPAS